ncbi:MAG: carboxypeptidase-like regulatory domain-containing protein [Jejuia sp.]
MKHFIVLVFALTSGFIFSQDTGAIIGKVLDKELNNQPLIFANISLEKEDFKSSSDKTGAFLIQNLADGKHTVICSYPGYESKKVDVEIKSGQPTEIEIALNARKLTLAAASSTSSTTDQ